MIERHPLASRSTQFLRSDAGAVTVDWVVLTAALVGLGLATLSVVSGGVEDLSNDTSAQLGSNIISTTFQSGPFEFTLFDQENYDAEWEGDIDTFSTEEDAINRYLHVTGVVYRMLGDDYAGPDGQPTESAIAVMQVHLDRMQANLDNLEAQGITISQADIDAYNVGAFAPLSDPDTGEPITDISLEAAYNSYLAAGLPPSG